MALIVDVARQFTDRAAFPVLCFDTCVLLDIVRANTRRNGLPETEAASRLLASASDDPGSIHLVLAELVIAEFHVNLPRVLMELEAKLSQIDDDHSALVRVAAIAEIAAISPLIFQKQPLIDAVRSLAERLLARAIKLDRDFTCVERGLDRVIDAKRPSHEMEVKDSLIFEQYLELVRRLRINGFAERCVFISSDKGFRDEKSSRIHPDLESDIQPLQFEFFPSLSAALGSLRI